MTIGLKLVAIQKLFLAFFLFCKNCKSSSENPWYVRIPSNELQNYIWNSGTHIKWQKKMQNMFGDFGPCNSTSLKNNWCNCNGMSSTSGWTKLDINLCNSDSKLQRPKDFRIDIARTNFRIVSFLGEDTIQTSRTALPHIIFPQLINVIITPPITPNNFWGFNKLDCHENHTSLSFPSYERLHRLLRQKNLKELIGVINFSWIHQIIIGELLV